MSSYTPPEHDSGLIAYEEYIGTIWDAYAGYTAHCVVTSEHRGTPFVVPLWRDLSYDAQQAFIEGSARVLDSVVDTVFAVAVRDAR